MAIAKFQLKRLSEGRAPRPDVSPVKALLLQQLSAACQSRRYRQWSARRKAV
jgi:hypothetical protein